MRSSISGRYWNAAISPRIEQHPGYLRLLAIAKEPLSRPGCQHLQCHVQELFSTARSISSGSGAARRILSSFRPSITTHSSSATPISLRVNAWIARSRHYCCPLDTCLRVVPLRPINITATWIGCPTSRTPLLTKRCNISRNFTPTLRVRWVNYASSAIGGYYSNTTRKATHRISAFCPARETGTARPGTG